MSALKKHGKWPRWLQKMILHKMLSKYPEACLNPVAVGKIDLNDLFIPMKGTLFTFNKASVLAGPKVYKEDKKSPLESKGWTENW